MLSTYPCLHITTPSWRGGRNVCLGGRCHVCGLPQRRALSRAGSEPPLCSASSRRTSSALSAGTNSRCRASWPSTWRSTARSWPRTACTRAKPARGSSRRRHSSRSTRGRITKSGAPTGQEHPRAAWGCVPVLWGAQGYPLLRTQKHGHCLAWAHCPLLCSGKEELSYERHCPAGPQTGAVGRECCTCAVRCLGGGGVFMDGEPCTEWRRQGQAALFS